MRRSYADVISVSRAFGEAYEKDGLTTIPAAAISGGGGGFGVTGRPVVVYQIKDGEAALCS